MAFGVFPSDKRSRKAVCGGYFLVFARRGHMPRPFKMFEAAPESLIVHHFSDNREKI
jgi:hypothetical protein